MSSGPDTNAKHILSALENPQFKEVISVAVVLGMLLLFARDLTDPSGFPKLPDRWPHRLSDCRYPSCTNANKPNKPRKKSSWNECATFPLVRSVSNS